MLALVYVFCFYQLWISNKLKELKHPANSGSLHYLKLKLNFWIFFWFWGCGYKNIQDKNLSPWKSFWKPLVCSPSQNFYKKGGFYQNGIEVMWCLWKIKYCLVFLFPWKFKLRKQIRVSNKKNLGGISLNICWISLQPQPQNENQTFS